MADAHCLASYEKWKNEHATARLADVKQAMETGNPELVYAKCISLYNSNNSLSGGVLEKIVEGLLKERGVPFLRQKATDADGTIIAQKRGSVHDIIIDAKLGDNIKDKVIVSCKTSLRDRYKQDGNLNAKSVYMVTFDAPKDFKKYTDMGIHVVTVGTGALEAMLAGFSAPLVEQPLISTLV